MGRGLGGGAPSFFLASGHSLPPAGLTLPTRAPVLQVLLVTQRLLGESPGTRGSWRPQLGSAGVGAGGLVSPLSPPVPIAGQVVGRGSRERRSGALSSVWRPLSLQTRGGAPASAPAPEDPPSRGFSPVTLWPFVPQPLARSCLSAPPRQLLVPTSTSRRDPRGRLPSSQALGMLCSVPPPFLKH